MRVNLNSIALDAATLSGIGIHQLPVAERVQQGYNFSEYKPFIRFAYQNELWDGSPTGIVLAFSPVNGVGTDNRQSGYGAELFVALVSNKTYIRSCSSTTWSAWTSVNMGGG